jgi:hypothetical protein
LHFVPPRDQGCREIYHAERDIAPIVTQPQLTGIGAANIAKLPELANQATALT